MMKMKSDDKPDLIKVMHDIFDGNHDLILTFKEIVGAKDFTPAG